MSREFCDFSGLTAQVVTLLRHPTCPPWSTLGIDFKTRFHLVRGFLKLFESETLAPYRTTSSRALAFTKKRAPEADDIPRTQMTKALDIGCGSNPKNTFNADELFGIDVREDVGANIYKADLVLERIPFEDEVFEYVTAHDFIEHVPRVIYVPHRRNAFVELMNEVWRVLKTGGLFLSLTPAFPHAPAFRDPTHVNIITDETFPLYFDQVNRWATMYGFVGSFEIVSQEWRGPHLLSILRKVRI